MYELNQTKIGHRTITADSGKGRQPMLLIRRTGLSQYSPKISQHLPGLQLYLMPLKKGLKRVVAHARNPSTGGDDEVEVILSHTVSGNQTKIQETLSQKTKTKRVHL